MEFVLGALVAIIAGSLGTLLSLYVDRARERKKARTGAALINTELSVMVHVASVVRTGVKIGSSVPVLDVPSENAWRTYGPVVVDYVDQSGIDLIGYVYFVDRPFIGRLAREWVRAKQQGVSWEPTSAEAMELVNAADHIKLAMRSLDTVVRYRWRHQILLRLRRFVSRSEKG